MKAQHTSGRAIRKILSACVLAGAPAMLWAQVSLYDFTQTQETWTEITAAQADYVLGTPLFFPPTTNYVCFVDPAQPNGVANNGYIIPAVGPGYPIGFNLIYNGDVFDRIGISNAGWIGFGKSSDGNQAVQVFMSDHPAGAPLLYDVFPVIPAYQRNRVAGWANSGLRQQDQSSVGGPLSSFRMATIGTAPNRVCVVQWDKWRADYSSNGASISFQIRLNEVDNSVDVRWGPMEWGYAGSGGGQVGLGGQSSADFNARTTIAEEPSFLYNWNETVAATTNGEFCIAAVETVGNASFSGVPPVEGLNFKWTPAVCPPPAWPLTIADLSFDHALAQWQATAAGEYEYFLTDTNDVNGPEVTSGTTTDPEVNLFGIEPATTYYIFVRSICGGEPGVWSLATSFLTYGGGVVVCDGGVVTENYCSHQYDVVRWLYSSADGSPLKIELQSGFVGNVAAEALKICDGTDTTGTVLQPVGDITGNFLVAASGNIYIQYRTDAGSCESQPWYLPFQWRVGCKNCTDPLVNFALGTTDCDNQQYYVDVDVFSLGSATSLSLDNNVGLPSTIVSATGIQSVGPFPTGQSVVVTAQNPDNLLCYASSASIINEPCVIQDCGPTSYTYCYGDNDYHQWAYQGATGQEIGIRFLEGTMGFGDVGHVYNGLDIQNLTPVNMTNFGTLSNALFTSAAPSTDHALVMELIADNAMSCQDADPLYGTSQPWTWVVACYDGCTQPQASYTTHCLSEASFEVNVDVTVVGNTGSVTITNDAGVAPMTAAAAGTYTVGPFPSGVPVTINVEGASVLCTWTSPALNPDCTGVGIEEQQVGRIKIRPNPSSGTFYLELPSSMSSGSAVEVLDLTGRSVAQEALSGSNATLHLDHLPNGLYTVVAHANGQLFTSKISIQH